MMRLSIVIALLAFLLAGCSLFDYKWYKPNSTQVEYDADAVECNQHAEKLGQAGSMSGKSVNIESYTDAFTKCLFDKGWSMVSPEEAARGLGVVIKPGPEGYVLTWGERSLRIPQGYELVNSVRRASGASLDEVFLFSKNGIDFINVTCELSPQLKIVSYDFPVSEPFMKYSSGNSEDKGKKLRYSTYFGRYLGFWVSGFGSIFVIDNETRIITVSTSVMPGPEQTPPPGLSVSKNQKDMLDGFENFWLNWLKRNYANDVKFAQKP